MFEYFSILFLFHIFSYYCGPHPLTFFNGADANVGVKDDPTAWACLSEYSLRKTWGIRAPMIFKKNGLRIKI